MAVLTMALYGCCFLPHAALQPLLPHGTASSYIIVCNRSIHIFFAASISFRSKVLKAAVFTVFLISVRQIEIKRMCKSRLC